MLLKNFLANLLPKENISQTFALANLTGVPIAIANEVIETKPLPTDKKSKVWSTWTTAAVYFRIEPGERSALQYNSDSMNKIETTI